MKKILHISKYYYPFSGGTEQIARDVVLALKGEYEQKVIAFNDGKEDKIDIVDEIEVIKCGCFTKIAAQSLSASYGKHLHKVMKEFNPDIVVFHYPNPFVATLLLRELKNSKAKLMVYWHLDIVRQKYLKLLFAPQNRSLLTRADKVIATSPNYIEGSKWLAVKYKGESSACFGDASMFSFHATKVFNTIEGGCVCFKDDSWVQLLNDMKNFGIHGPESVQFVGANAKMNEFQATMGICNLKHLNKEIEKRKHVVEHYRSRLEGVEGIKLSIIQKDVESNYAYFPVVFDGYKYTRNEIFEKLAEVGIGARKYFYPLTNSFECYRNYPTAGAEKTPVAQHIALRVLTLPLYADLSLKDVDRICDVILG